MAGKLASTGHYPFQHKVRLGTVTWSRGNSKSVPKGGADDASWLQKELTADLEKFLDPKKKLRRPEYYLAITNVTLTSVVSGSTSRKGGQEKIEDLFELFKERLGLRGWLVWHADVLSSMLDADQETFERDIQHGSRKVMFSQLPCLSCNAPPSHQSSPWR